jgi:hypothetical protein
MAATAMGAMALFPAGFGESLRFLEESSRSFPEFSLLEDVIKCALVAIIAAALFSLFRPGEFGGREESDKGLPEEREQGQERSRSGAPPPGGGVVFRPAPGIRRGGPP